MVGVDTVPEPFRGRMEFGDDHDREIPVGHPFAEQPARGSALRGDSGLEPAAHGSSRFRRRPWIRVRPMIRRVRSDAGIELCEQARGTTRRTAQARIVDPPSGDALHGGSAREVGVRCVEHHGVDVEPGKERWEPGTLDPHGIVRRIELDRRGSPRRLR